MIIKICEYKGFEIEYDDMGNEGFTIKGHYDIKKDKLEEIKKVVDKIVKKDFENFKVLKEEYDRAYFEVEVTSIGEDGYYWIINKDGRRSKENPKNLYKINEKNNVLIREILDIGKKVGELNTKRNALKEELETEYKEKIKDGNN